MKNKDEKGFTLIELIIIIAIIGILATIAIPRFAGYRKKSFDATSISDLRNAGTAQEAYFSDYQVYCPNLANLQAAPYNFFLSRNVTVNIPAADAVSYTMTAYHSSSGRIYTLSGPGGSISP